ncbi:MAG: hypothetical protein K2G75_02795, partial [Muribaculaceae bacterium]|nr:hypothetical protein [Muribaculaceae bacterium]
MMNLTPKKSNRPQQRRPMFNMYWMYALIILCLLGLYYFQDNSQTVQTDWTKFQDAAAAGQFDKITVIAENGVAKGKLNAEGIKAQKIDSRFSDAADIELEASIPSADKISDKIDQW